MLGSTRARRTTKIVGGSTCAYRLCPAAGKLPRGRALALATVLLLLPACGTRGRNAIVLGAPLAPAGPSPWDGERGVIPGTPLRWAPAEGATSYVVHWGSTVDVPAALGAPAVNISDPPPAQAPGATVYWRVDAVNAAGVTSGPVWSYRIAAASTLGESGALPPDDRFETTLWGVSSPSSWRFGQVLHVDARSAAASDGNPGTATAPLKTLARAMAVAAPSSAGGTRIVVHPGTYREGVTVPPEKSGTAQAPMLIEADPVGQAILTGTDVWTGWTTDAGNVYYKPWTLTWGVAVQDPTWPDIAELGRRREMVFVDGELYRQVLTRAEMTAGTYYVDEMQGRLYVWFASDPAQHEVEVAVRDRGVYLGNQWTGTDLASYVAVRGLVIRGFEDSSVVGRHVLVEDCRFEWNDGQVFAGGDDYVLRRNRMIHGGKLGITVPVRDASIRHQHGLLQDNETSECNWRWGGLGGLTGYSVAGTKVHSADHLVVRGHIARRNAMPGLWFDNNSKNVLIEDSLLEDNFGTGLWLETDSGAVVVRNNVFVRNDMGINIGSSSHVSIVGNLIYDNGTAQISSWSPGTPERATQRMSYLHIVDNVIGTTPANAASSYVSLTGWDYVYSGETAVVISENSYSGSSNPLPFHAADTDMDAATWQARTGESGADLRPFALRDPDADDFTPLAGSPLLTRAHWSWVSVRVDGVVSITATPQAAIHYTLDGTAPSAASPLYTGPISDTASTIRARATGYGLWSPIATVTR